MFNKSLLRKARKYFARVYDDGDRVRIYPTSWWYEDEDICHDDNELKKLIQEEEKELREEAAECQLTFDEHVNC